MKKKKILLGLFLAATATITLASCGKDKEQDDSKDTTTVVETTSDDTSTSVDISTSTSTQTSNTTSQNTTTTSAQDTTTSTDTFTSTTTTIINIDTTTGTNTTTTEIVPETFSVTYHSDYGTVPTTLEDVTKLPDQLPVLTDTEYNFVGWTLQEGSTTLVTAGTAITSNIDLYAVWVSKTQYEKISQKDGCVYASQFGESSTINQYSDDNYLNPNAYSKTEQTEGNYVSIVDGKLAITDTTTSSTEAYISLGMLYSGKVEGTMKYTPVNTDKSLNGGWSMVQFYGYVGTKFESLFALRTNNDKKIQLVFSSESTKTANNKTVYTFRGTEFTYEANKEYEINWSYDFTTSLLSISIDGTDVLSEYEVPEKSQPLFLSGLGFITAGDDTKRGAKIDDFAVAVSNSKNLEETKEFFTTIINDDFSRYDLQNTYYLTAQDITDAKDSAVNSINNATSNNAVIERFTIYFSEVVKGFKTDLTIKSEAIDYVNASKEENAQNYQYYKEEFDSFYADLILGINNALSLDDIDYIKFNAFKNDFEYSDDNTVRDGTINLFNSAVEDVLADIELIDDITSDEILEASGKIAEVVAKYFDTDLDTSFINCQITSIDDIYTNALGELNDIYSLYDLTIDELVEQYNEQIQYKKDEAKELTYDHFDALIDEVTLLDADDIYTKAEVKAVYDDIIGLIDYYVAWNASVTTNIGIIENYALEQRNSDDILDKTSPNYEDLINSLTSYRNTCLSELENIEYYIDDYNDIVEAFILNAEQEIDDIITTYKNNTEAVITFKAFAYDEEAIDVKRIVKGSTVTATDIIPTADGLSFKEWDFNFENTISENITIVALWYDVYGLSNTITSTVTFKGMTAVPTGDDGETAFGTKNKDVLYTIDGVTYTSHNTSSGAFGMESNGLKLSKSGQSITFDVSAGGEVTFYLRNGKDDGTRAFNITSTSGLSLTNIGKGYSLPSGVTGVTVTTGKDCSGGSDGNCIKIVITSTENQTITISCGGTKPDTVHIQQIIVKTVQGISSIVGSIDADIAIENRYLKVSNVKLYDTKETPEEIVTLTSDEYNVEIRDSNKQLVNPITQLTEGETYSVTISYGEYTMVHKTITVTKPIEVPYLDSEAIAL